MVAQALELGPPAAAKKTPKQPRKMTAKCWMAANFPISMRQLIPILDIVAYTNKHLGRVSNFMRKYGDMDLFPVKLQVGGACPCSLAITEKRLNRMVTRGVWPC